MPGGAGAVGAGMQNVGSTIDLVNNANAVKRRDRLLVQGMREQDRAGQETASEFGSLADLLRRSRPDVQGSRAQFASALRGTPRVGGPMTASAAFRGDAAGTNAGLDARSAWLAELAGQMQAPQLQQVHDNEAVNRSGERMGLIRSRAAGQDFLTQLRASMTQPNPYNAIAAGWWRQTGQNLGSLGGGGGE
jgi:hypothetical protein